MDRCPLGSPQSSHIHKQLLHYDNRSVKSVVHLVWAGEIPLYSTVLSGKSEWQEHSLHSFHLDAFSPQGYSESGVKESIF